MKFEKRHKIESAVASKKDYREKLQDCYLDVEKPRLLATDGHILAIVPVETGEHDTTGYISVEALTSQRKATGKKVEHVELACNGSVALPDGRTFPREDYGIYPNVDSVLPKPESRNFHVALNADLLHRLADAIGSEVVVLHFDTTNPLGCISVTGKATLATGAIMPCKL